MFFTTGAQLQAAINALPTTKTGSFVAFDAFYYGQQYMSAGKYAGSLSPVEHFVQIGAAQGNKPSAAFDPVYYAGKYTDLAGKGYDAADLLFHFLQFGLDEGRVPNASLASFDGAAYLAAYPAVATYVNANLASFGGSATNGAIAHFVKFGQAQGFVVPGAAAGTGPITLNAETNNAIGTPAADVFEAYLSQNSFAGGISNTLSSADRINGLAGADTLNAELVPEFFGATANGTQIDVQPRIAGVETINLEARDAGANDIATAGEIISFDAKYVTGVNSIGSKFSDGDLVIENLTTQRDDGTARNTADLTVTMDHTDNYNSDNDASDLTVYLDEDYLLAGQTSQASAFYFLLDEAAELAGKTARLEKIDVNGIRFTLGTSTTPLSIFAPEAILAGTHAGFVAALQAPLAKMIADGVLPAGSTLTLDSTRIDTTGLDNGSISAAIPAILLTTGNGTKVVPIGFSRVADAIGQYDVYGQFGEVSAVQNLPVTINIDLNKVGREGEGGNLIIGGKELDQDSGRDNEGRGITVFNVEVFGDSTKPSNLGILDSTNGDLETINIKTDPSVQGGVPGYASLTIRDGFGAAGTDVRNQVLLDSNLRPITNDLKTVNANEFKGDLTLGEDTRVLNLDTLDAVGGGKIDFRAEISGTEKGQIYSYTTGAADDKVDLLISGSGVDYAGSSVNVVTGAGKDDVSITTAMTDAQGNQILNQVILKNITVDTGADDDTVALKGGSQGDVTINTGAGNDFIDTSAGAASAVWAFNYDDARTNVTTLGSTAATNLPGVQTSLAFLGGASLTLTLSGAGVAALDGGVMAVNDILGDGVNFLSRAFADGYELTIPMGTLLNGNTYFGDQRDINAAIVKAITENTTFNKLLTAAVRADNTLVITSKTGGAFNSDDLEITLTQATAGTSSSAVLTEARKVFQNSSLTLTQLWGSEAPTAAATYVGENDGAGAIGNDATVALNVERDNYYTGLGVDNATLHTAGVSSAVETDNIINGGTGNDIIVLSTDAVANAVPAYSVVNTNLAIGVVANNRLLNGASNETIKLTDAAFGNDVIMNFTANAALPGVDFLDYSNYLTSKVSASGSADSTKLVPTTLAIDVLNVAANEVAVIRFDNTDTTDTTETFGNLTGSQIASLFNFKTGDKLGTNTQVGNLTAGTFSVVTTYDDANTTASPKIDLVSGAGKAVVMVENADNLGLYKVFELNWYGGETDVASTHTVTAVDLGSLDFGTTLVGMTDISLTGSASNKALQLGTAGVVVPTYAVAANAASANEGTTGVFTVTTTGVADGTVLTYALTGVTTTDVVGGALAGTVTITGNTGTISVPLAADVTTEGAETLTATVMTRSASMTVNDTSVAGGVQAALTVPVTATNGGVANPATAGLVTYNIAAPAASYQFDITGFAAGDVLDFAAGSANSVTNVSGTDGIIDIVGTIGAASVTIHLVGVLAATDAMVFNEASFNTAFGAGSLI